MLCQKHVVSTCCRFGTVTTHHNTSRRIFEQSLHFSLQRRNVKMKSYLIQEFLLPHNFLRFFRMEECGMRHHMDIYAHSQISPQAVSSRHVVEPDGKADVGRSLGTLAGLTEQSTVTNQPMAPTNPAKKYPKRGEDVVLECYRLAYKGMGVCRVPDTGFVVLCERALPGETLVARVTKKKKGHAEAYKLRTLTPHHNAVEPPCQHFPACGGCKLQNLSYEGQLAAKQSQVEELMERVGKMQLVRDGTPVVLPIVGCEQQYKYRNKMEFSFGSRIWEVKPHGEEEGEAEEEAGEGEESSWPPAAAAAPPLAGGRTLMPRGGRGGKPKYVPANPHQFALGLHAPRRFDKILPIHHCSLQGDTANQILSVVSAYCGERTAQLPPYDSLTHTGCLRHLTIRTGSDGVTGQETLSVNIVSSHAGCRELLVPLAHMLLERFPTLVSVVHTVNPAMTEVNAPSSSTSSSEGQGQGQEGGEERSVVLAGVSHLTQTLRGLHFDISPHSFFQTNTRQAEVLYRLVEEACDLSGDQSEVLLDLFCGTGTIGLSMASKVRHVYGYELVPEAVVDARRNAARNGITNATFVQGDLNKLSAGFGAHLPTPDVVITDPNRPGMHPKLIKFLKQKLPPRIVYVSCNPASCARDVDMLCHGEGGGGGGEAGPYQLLSVQPVDMFPQTTHVECIAVLTKKVAN